MVFINKIRFFRPEMLVSLILLLEILKNKELGSRHLLCKGLGGGGLRKVERGEN